MQENYSLQSYNSFGIEAKTDFFLEIHNEKDFESVFPKLKDFHKILILGGGNNILFQSDFKGLVLKNNIQGIEIIEENDQEILLKVGAGEDWVDFVSHCVQHNWAGIENLAYIPGSVGASPIQNIGAYGVEVKDCLHKVQAIHLKTGKKQSFTNKECEFGYRESIFKTKFKGEFFITHVEFRLMKTPAFKLDYGNLKDELSKYDQLTLQNIEEAVTNIRKSKLPEPKELGNAGSFFKNPIIELSLFEKIKTQYPEIPSYPAGENKIKVPAGWLIEKSGWKGLRLGDVSMHCKQALVLVNYGKATGKELIEHAERVQQGVLEKFEIKLEMEVNIL